MKRIFSLCLLSFFLLSIEVSLVFSQKTDDILEKMIEALGGKKVLANIKDSVISGSLEMPMISSGIGTITIHQKEPNKIRTDVEIMGIVLTQAFDGEKAWLISPPTGATEELPKEAEAEIRREASGFDALIHPEKYGISYDYKGKERIEDNIFLVLEQSFSDGQKRILYIDPETYLIYKIKTATFNTMMGVEAEVETFTSDYKRVDGVMMPFSITTFQNDKELMKMTVSKVSFNIGLKDSLFMYGQMEENIELISEPPGAEVYLIPLYIWENDPSIISDDTKLSKFQVPEGNTPVVTRAFEMVYMVVFELKGKKITRKLDVIAGKVNRVKVSFK